MSTRVLSVLLVLLLGRPFSAAGFELQPLGTRNLSPTALIYGLPALGPAQVLPDQAGRARLNVDLVNNFTRKASGQEVLRFDGETHRLALVADYGIGSDLELGLEIPVGSHQGGFLDDFIKDWHSAFSLPQSGRTRAEDDQLEYSYSRPGGGFSLQSAQAGLGDIALRAAWQLWRDPGRARSVALRASLKLPTGQASRLLGSGSTDLALWLSGEQRLQSSRGPLFVYGGGGCMFTSDGDLLPAQKRPLVGLFNFGVGWQPSKRFGLQLQIDGHTALFSNSELAGLNQVAGQLALGGSYALAQRTLLEVALVEDLLVFTAPDVVFHLGLIRYF
jgi:hypothetical protein